jgi:putative transposase
MDFQFDTTTTTTTTADGRLIKLLNVIDESMMERPATEVNRSIDADHVVAVLDRIAPQRGGAPVCIRLDSGPEFVAYTFFD